MMIKHDEEAIRVLRIVANEVRYKILTRIRTREESVSSLAEYIGASQTVTSQHLSLMHRANILQRSRKINKVYYRLKCDKVSFLLNAIHLMSNVKN